jgi:membrane associated rhomboid family serine protease
VITRFLVGVNIIVYLWEVVVTHGAMLSVNPDPYSTEIVLRAGALAPIQVLQYHQYWRIVTSAFLHDGLLHIGVNMYSLYVLGRFVEPVLGSARMLLVYLISMLASGFGVVYFSAADVATLGASGAIFGIFGALFAIGFKFGKHGMDLVKAMLPILILNLIFTFAIPEISKAAHVSGLLAGFLLTFAIYFPPKRVRPHVYDAGGSVLDTEYEEPSDDVSRSGS